jgi:EAL domain-containing protein (putative c-di-GMP-specific phosphodiesterase class I)
VAAGTEGSADASSGASRRAAPIAHLIDRRGRCRLAYEPVADLARGVICGYEAVVRSPEALSEQDWTEEAGRRGLEPDLHAFVVGSVLEARESLPDDCFLSFNIRPETLLRAPVQATLARWGRLDRLVVELCPRVVPDEDALLDAIGRLRAAGATIAVDDVGSGVGTLRHIAVVRPEFVKLDAGLVAGLDRDEAKHAMVQTIGELASRLDAWIVPQGITTIDELDALIRLRAPLAQGPLIGVRAKTLTRVAFALSAYVRDRGAANVEPGALTALIERPRPVERAAGRAAWAQALAEDPAPSHLPVVDERRRPVGILARVAFERGEGPAGEVLVVAPSAHVPEVAARAMLRPPPTRFDPLVCCDAQGRYVGVVPVERLVTALAAARGAVPSVVR